MKGLIAVDDVMATLPEKRRKAIEARGSQLLIQVEQQIEEGYLQAERGELVPGVEARQQIDEMKRRWCANRQRRR
jgi:hypothetical protein